MNELNIVENFIKNIKNKTQIFSNLPSIFEKSETNGYLHCVHLTLDNIFQQELRLTINGRVIRIQQNQSKKQKQQDFCKKFDRKQSVRFQRKFKSNLIVIK